MQTKNKKSLLVMTIVFSSFSVVLYVISLITNIHPDLLNNIGYFVCALLSLLAFVMLIVFGATGNKPSGKVFFILFTSFMLLSYLLYFVMSLLNLIRGINSDFISHNILNATQMAGYFLLSVLMIITLVLVGVHRRAVVSMSIAAALFFLLCVSYIIIFRIGQSMYHYAFFWSDLLQVVTNIFPMLAILMAGLAYREVPKNAVMPAQPVVNVIHYPPQGGGHMQGNYPPQGGNRMQGNYPPQGGIRMQGNYPPQGGIRMQGNYPPQGGNRMQGNYPPQNASEQSQYAFQNGTVDTQNEGYPNYESTIRM